MTPEPLLIARERNNESIFCNAASLAQRNINCREEFCECTHVLSIPLNSTVELILVDEGFKYDANHPFHLHGHDFRVVGMERIKPSGITVEEVLISKFYCCNLTLRIQLTLIGYVLFYFLIVFYFSFWFGVVIKLRLGSKIR